MARTVQAVIDRVREILQDDGTRYTDTQICGHLRDAYQQARSVRPDLFVTKYAIALPDVVVATDPFFLDDQFFSATALYCAGMCELRDDEFAVDGRALTIGKALVQKLTSGI